jgi:hypothetical protein
MNSGVSSSPQTAIEYQQMKDRSTGLIVFGVLALLVAAFCACIGMLSPFALAMESMMPPGSPPIDRRSVILYAVLYMLMAVLFIALGVGSFQARRWVRPVMLSVAWTWLIFGLSTLAIWLWTIPRMGALMRAANPNQPVPESMVNAITLFTGVMMVVTQIALPLSFILFYRSKHVQATLAERNPLPSWTDRCPVPVLTLSFGLAAGAVMLLGTSVYAVAPAFGVLLTGPGAVGLLVVAAIASAWAAWATYKLQPAGWWGTLVLMVLLAAAIVPTFMRVNLADVYAVIGAAPEQLAIYRSISTTMINIVTVAMTVFGIIYLLRIRKYFGINPRASV